jgi:uncharacterized protein
MSHANDDADHRRRFAFKFFEYLTLVVLIIGALNWGLIGLFKFDLVAKIMGELSPAARAVYILVGFCGLVHLLSRDYYLPFLGEAVFPCGPLVAKVPSDANVQVVVSVAPNSNVIYWAADHKQGDGKEGEEILKNPWVAYGQYSNAGVARSDDKGRAVLRVRKPPAYRVPPFGRELKPHVHYRVCDHDGMMSPVRTVEIA